MIDRLRAGNKRVRELCIMIVGGIILRGMDAIQDGRNVQSVHNSM